MLVTSCCGERREREREREREIAEHTKPLNNRGGKCTESRIKKSITRVDTTVRDAGDGGKKDVGELARLVPS